MFHLKNINRYSLVIRIVKNPYANVYYKMRE